MSVRRPTLANIGLAAASVTVALLLAEAALWILAPVGDPYESVKAPEPVNEYVRSAFPPHLRLRTDVEPGLPGMEGPNWFTTNNLGFRGDSLIRPKPPGEFRIFMIGGSTTECFYLDDRDAITAVLQRDLQAAASSSRTIRVYNAGRSGDRTDDHISMLVHRIMHLQPDLVIIFAGVNDLSASIYHRDWAHFAPADTTRLARLTLARLLRLTATEFQIPRRLFYLLRGRAPAGGRTPQEAIPLRSAYRQLAAQRRRAPPAPAPPRIDSAAYAINLRTLAGAARGNGVGLVFMTQPTTWASRTDTTIQKWHWLRYRNGVTFDEHDMDEAMNALNRVMRQVAEDVAVPVYDLASVLPKSSDFFYDDVHFNRRGARTAARGLAAFLRHAALIP